MSFSARNAELKRMFLSSDSRKAFWAFTGIIVVSIVTSKINRALFLYPHASFTIKDKVYQHNLAKQRVGWHDPISKPGVPQFHEE